MRQHHRPKQHHRTAITRPHHLHAMCRCSIVTDVARSVVYTVQKWLNRILAGLQCWLMWTKGAMYYMGFRSPHGKGHYLGGRAPAHCNIFWMTARSRLLRALCTVWLPRVCSRWVNLPPVRETGWSWSAMRPFTKLLWTHY